MLEKLLIRGGNVRGSPFQIFVPLGTLQRDTLVQHLIDVVCQKRKTFKQVHDCIRRRTLVEINRQVQTDGVYVLPV